MPCERAVVGGRGGGAGGAGGRGGGDGGAAIGLSSVPVPRAAGADVCF